jgi:hypothetical protein
MLAKKRYSEGKTTAYHSTVQIQHFFKQVGLMTLLSIVEAQLQQQRSVSCEACAFSQHAGESLQL